MFNTHEITAGGTFEQFGLVKEEIVQWIVDNFDPVSADDSNLWANKGSGYIMEPDHSRFACYKVDARGEEIWRIECTDGIHLFIVAHAGAGNYDDPKIAVVDKNVLKELQERTELENEGRNSETSRRELSYNDYLVPVNKEHFCVGPKDWWLTNFERVSSAEDLIFHVSPLIREWLANNPDKDPIDFPYIKRNGGGIVPKEHAEWFNEQFAELIKNFYATKESVQLVDTEIRHTENELKRLKEKRRSIFNRL